MPQRPPKGCRKAHCPNTTIEAHGYCESHKDLGSWGLWQSQRGTSTQRGYGAAWRRLRSIVLSRDDHLCQPCLKTNHITPANIVDHIRPKSHGGTNALSNLQAICDPCHKVKTASERS